jgi:mono/diheme cytochrome c family protein
MEMGFPGNYYAKNLTPYHLEDWTDGEIFRAITSGVNKDGKSMFPIMPYPNYGKADKEDIYDIIAYLRSLEPVEHDVPESSSAFPMSLIINVMPMDPEFTTKPAPSDKLAYGKYLVTVASCGDCHTPMEQGQPIPGMEFAGGMEFGVQSGGITTSANITPHPETGIGSWTEELFISRFKQYEDSTLYVNQTIVEPGQPNTEMPWRFYSKMSEEDLGAIFAYLQTVESVDNKIETFRGE